MTAKLANKVAIVTGAGRNIGEEVAKLLAAEGAAVAVVDVDKGRADKVASDIIATGGKAKGFVCDVGQEEDIIATVHGAVAEWGHVDILVNNAAISDNRHMFDITTEEWNRTLAITLTGPFLFAKHTAKAMVEKGVSGAIVNVSSTSGYYGRDRAIGYAAAKGGIVNMTRSMAIQLAPHNIRVNSVVPNKIGSPVGRDTFNPDRKVVNLRNRHGLPIDLAKAILFLVSDDSDFVAGTALWVDGGVSAIMPGNE
ncbi:MULTISPECIES: SDR family NAD(P)-dependent oxidoreductase [unclassified Beijerinckia]|uniref:SDR family NAD(P)-dependent oxidoreductase n=1 Tax=unclassified Beijerinckia TaxID=2638183 RepID=UPI00089CF746|nr:MULTISPECIES: SDR family NAD(P)-dependent oxidoreductase [unclassified Beijerinckia]MDH7795334.1 NAD(P)-dependent dehydrogenase (short-subunit alcohol dehydrogenase family) [Beijerinckia sp. GAS462]SEB97231.1 glucose 1-dehydrogenase [Beijerinckia sp. 28-YEA-48]